MRRLALELDCTAIRNRIKGCREKWSVCAETDLEELLDDEGELDAGYAPARGEEKMEWSRRVNERIRLLVAAAAESVAESGYPLREIHPALIEGEFGGEAVGHEE